nr:MAG TPA: hypothetical protein [Bacteriophage sp.]
MDLGMLQSLQDNMSGRKRPGYFYYKIITENKMSEHPLSSITKSHITNCLRTMTNKRIGRFRTDSLSVGIELSLHNDKDDIRHGFMILKAKEIGTDILYGCTYCLRDRHIEENILEEDEFRLTSTAIELVASKWISDIQRAILENKQ